MSSARLLTFITVLVAAVLTVKAEPRRVWVKCKHNSMDNCIDAVQKSAAKSASKSMTSSSSQTSNSTTLSSILEVNMKFPQYNAIVVTSYDEDALLDLETDQYVDDVSDDPKRYVLYIPESPQKEESSQKGNLRGENQRNLHDGRQQDRHLSGGLSLPYGIDMVQAPDVWKNHITGSGVTVCVVDSGLDKTNPEFSGRLSGYSYVTDGGSDGWYIDGLGHGTHVSGTIKAKFNKEGVVGVAPDSGVYLVRVFNNQGAFVYSSALVAAVQKCRDAGARIISMSLGGSRGNSIEEDTFQSAFDSGIISIAAAGNDGDTSALSYPASYSSVISVAAINSDKQRASFSQHNAMVDIAAPGVKVYSTLPMSSSCVICSQYNTVEYGYLSGTSMATPHVSGVAALLLSAHPELTAEEVKAALLNSAEDLGTPGRDDYYGYGLVQAAAALAYIESN